MARRLALSWPIRPRPRETALAITLRTRYNRLDSLLRSRLFKLGETMAQKNAAESKTRVRRITAKDDEAKQPSPHKPKSTAPTKKTTDKAAKKTVTATGSSPKQKIFLGHSLLKIGQIKVVLLFANWNNFSLHIKYC